MIKIAGAFLISALISCILGPIVFKLARKLRAEQPILGYVDNHSSKSGTPTMGGIIFVVGSAITAFIFLPVKSTGIACAVTMIAFAVIGFLDDYIKVRFKRNMGLKAYQKILSQGAVGVILSILVANVLEITEVILPFSKSTLRLGAWAIPLYFLTAVGASNAVNLTDGLDGLATVTSAIAYTAFAVLCVLGGNLECAVFCACVAGGLAVFLVVNCFPAKIFMGDTGSLALGGGLSAVAMLSGNTLYLPVLGLPFVASALSVIIQVVYFKLSGGKRVFLMAPLHHHLERLGIHENKITLGYGAVSLFLAVLTLALA